MPQNNEQRTYTITISYAELIAALHSLPDRGTEQIGRILAVESEPRDIGMQCVTVWFEEADDATD